MATAEELETVIGKFAQNYPQDGYVVFDSHAAINFMGSILVNYKGLRVVRLQKSQLMAGQFMEPDFAALCDQVLSGPNKTEELFQSLKTQYPQCSICIFQGGLYRFSGELASFKKGQVLALIF